MCPIETPTLSSPNIKCLIQLSSVNDKSAPPPQRISKSSAFSLWSLPTSSSRRVHRPLAISLVVTSMSRLHYIRMTKECYLLQPKQIWIICPSWTPNRKLRFIQAQKSSTFVLSCRPFFIKTSLIKALNSFLGCLK